MPSDATEALIAVYQQAWLDITDRLNVKLTKGNSTRYEKALLADINRILVDLDSHTQDWINAHLPEIYRDGMQAGADQLKAAGVIGANFTSSLVGINRSAVEILANNFYDDLVEANNFVGRRVNDIFREAGIEAITSKVATGQTIDQTSRNLQQLLRNRGVTAFTDKRGRQWDLDTYAAMVARTTSAEATNRGTLNQLSDLHYDLVTIPPHYPTCPICAPIQGRTYSISGKDKRFPPLWGTGFNPPYATPHPGCEHRVAPVVESLMSPSELKDAQSFSNRPFDIDPRSKAEIETYNNGQIKKRMLRADRKQLQRYKAVLPEDAPTTLSSFRRMKQANSPKYQELQELYRKANRIAAAS